MFSFNKKKLEPTLQNENDLKERLFFHDVINQTHGILLYLNHKEMTGETVGRDEIQLIEKEIKTLQSLIRDHFSYKHKNLVQTYDWVTFSYAKLAFMNLGQTYLNDMNVTTQFTICPVKAEEELIYYPSFYRIMNNLIKNIRESQCSKVEFDFVLNEKGLFIETKNQLKKSPESIELVILNEKDSKIQGLGLDSIHHLAEELGGSFSFEIENSTWLNKIYLPTKKIKTDKIAA